ncbi:Cysteine/O-acetylserine efflux protein [Labrenzia sp. THAF82]|uniref:LysE family translocator n=1 Tax=Labrenzia sp. THAF82 TaxID=2587861 RepID=UPI0012698439|nr:LysE family translocator [Labrenzia sp. THAF82]QFT33959.1 Cysteine/O-acetylserine efflux protein [Labrenzia sp. THAF82]
MQDLTTALIVPVGVFALTLVASPGPNNLMLSSSGTNFGFRRTVPHMLGVSLGSPILLLVLASGANVLFEYNSMRVILRYLCLAYVFWLAFKIATSPHPKDTDRARPLTFLQAAAFQWVNPKVWSQYVSVLAVFVPQREDFWVSVIVIAIVFLAVGLPVAVLWTMLGQVISRFLNGTLRLRLFNVAMAVLLVCSVARSIVDMPLLGPGS